MTYVLDTNIITAILKRDEKVRQKVREAILAEEPIAVHKSAVLTIALPPELAARNTFFARLHNATSVEDWLRSIIRERLDFE